VETAVMLAELAELAEQQILEILCLQLAAMAVVVDQHHIQVRQLVELVVQLVETHKETLKDMLAVQMAEDKHLQVILQY
jgi:hypothetical protein